MKRLFVNLSSQTKSVLKKGTVMILCMMMVGTGMFNSCKKDNVFNNMKQEDVSPVKQKRPLNDAEKKVVSLTDAAGALIGAAAGSMLGPVGAAAGAVIGGIAASLEMRREIENGTIVIQSESLPNIDNSPAGNDNNPYDYIGRMHYLAMNDFLVNPSRYCDANGKFSPEIYYGNIVNMLPNYTTAIPQSVIANFGIDNVTTSIDMSSKPMETILQGTGTIISTELKYLLIEYENYSKTCTSFDIFYNYSVSKEKDVLNNAFFSDVEKQVALSYMSTLRWGYWYWDNIQDAIVPPTIPITTE